MFADDVACFSDSIVRLQQQINCIQRFCEAVGMSLNLLKTKIIVFRNGGIVKEIEHWFYQGEHIDIVSAYKYLGIYFTPKLIWTKTKEVLAYQANKAVNRIFLFQRQFGFFTPKDIFKLFDAIVSPILCYGSEVWGYEYSTPIEKVHVKFCKRFIGLNQNTADFYALSECGRYPLSVIYMSRCIKYWVRILQMPDHRYPKQCYIMLRSLSDAGKITWATQVKNLLYKYGFGYVWEANTVGDMNVFIKMFKQRLIDCCQQMWQSDINESSKALLYRKYKLVLEIESYLTFPELPYLYRKTLANFRCSSHPLMIEKGRHQHIDRNIRFCPLCLKRNVYVVEDEFHFVCVCPSYNDIRNIYFKLEWKTNLITDMLFIRIMSSTDKESIVAISKYLVSALSYRNTCISSSD